MRITIGSSSSIPIRFVIVATVAECKEISKQALAESGWAHVREQGNKVIGAPSQLARILEGAFDLLGYHTANVATFEFRALPNSETLVSLTFKSSQKAEKANQSCETLLALVQKVGLHFGKPLDFEPPEAVYLYNSMSKLYPEVFPPRKP